jgi:hypothetical protein
MSDSLRLFSSMKKHVRKFLPTERITRQRNLALLITGLVLARSVHLAHLVRKWPLPAKTSSLTNRLRRFLSNARLVPQRCYRPVCRMLLQRFERTTLRLLLDVTQVGTRHRMLTVAVAYRGRALPLAWSLHRGTRGVVSNAATIALLERLVPLVAPSTSVVVLGDSAFGHVPVMQWLSAHGWDFVLRLRGCYRCYRVQEPGTATAGEASSAWSYVRDYRPAPGGRCFVGAVCFTAEHALTGVYLVTHWGKGEEEPWYLMSSRPVSGHTLRLYRVRMWTEEFYGDLKGHGFDLEATRLGGTQRIERLVLGVFYAYVWLLALGSSVVKRGLRPLVDRRDRRDKSYFRIGWDYLERRLRLGQAIPVRFQPYL